MKAERGSDDADGAALQGGQLEDEQLDGGEDERLWSDIAPRPRLDELLTEGGAWGPPSGGGASPWLSGVIDVGTLAGAVRRDLGLILGCSGLAFALALAWTLSRQMTFRSVGRLYLGDSVEQSGPPGQDIDIVGHEPSDVLSEIQVLKSRTLIERAILAAGLNTELRPALATPPTYLEWRLSGRNTTLMDRTQADFTVVEALLSDAAADSQTYSLAFSAGGRFRVDSEDGVELGAGRLGEVVRAGDLTLELAMSEEPPRAGSVYELVVHPLEDVVIAVSENLEITEPAASVRQPVRVVELSFVGDSPASASGFLRRLMEAYLQQKQSWKVANASAAEAFVTDQVREMRQRLDATRSLVADFRAEHPVVITSQEKEQLLDTLSSYEELRDTTRLALVALRAMKGALRKADAPLERYLLNDATDHVLQDMATKLVAARQTLVSLGSEYHQSTLEIKQAAALVEELRANIRGYIDNRLIIEQNRLVELDKIIAEHRVELNGLPYAELELNQIEYESEIYSRVFSSLLERQQEAAVVKASTISKNRILDEPKASSREVKPGLLPCVLAGIAGMFVSLGLVLLRVVGSPRARSEAEARQLAGGDRWVIGSIRRREVGRKARARAPGSSSAGDEAYQESIKALFLRFRQLCPEPCGQVLLLTSPSKGDGKTTTALSLAAMAACHDERCIVVDLGAPPAGGGDLARAIGQDMEAGKVYQHHVDQDVFDATYAGVKSSNGVLRSSKASTTIEDLRQEYDLIIVDAPSFPESSDAMALSSLTDVTVSLVCVGNTERKTAEDHLREMRAAVDNHFVVTNRRK